MCTISHQITTLGTSSRSLKFRRLKNSLRIAATNQLSLPACIIAGEASTKRVEVWGLASYSDYVIPLASVALVDKLRRTNLVLRHTPAQSPSTQPDYLCHHTLPLYCAGNALLRHACVGVGITFILVGDNMQEACTGLRRQDKYQTIRSFIHASCAYDLIAVSVHSSFTTALGEYVV
jgi:hypothetical protein